MEFGRGATKAGPFSLAIKRFGELRQLADHFQQRELGRSRAQGWPFARFHHDCHDVKYLIDKLE